MFHLVDIGENVLDLLLDFVKFFLSSLLYSLKFFRSDVNCYKLRDGVVSNDSLFIKDTRTRTHTHQTQRVSPVCAKACACACCMCACAVYWCVLLVFRMCFCGTPGKIILICAVERSGNSTVSLTNHMLWRVGVHLGLVLLRAGSINNVKWYWCEWCTDALSCPWTPFQDLELLYVKDDELVRYSNVVTSCLVVPAE